jgi:D-alanyl-D-alanine carboxypeptidase
MRRVLVTAMVVAAMGLVTGLPASAAAPPTTAGTPAAPRAWLLADADRGAVLSAANDHEALFPASTAKLMTALVAIEKLQLNGSILVSEVAADRPAMKIGMHDGEQWSINDALHALLMVSANDAAYALAEASSGSVEQFAKDAGKIGARLGMHESTWTDPAGLDDEYASVGGSKASAFDLAVAARNVLSVPELAQITSLTEYRFTGPDGHGHVLRNHDRLLTRYAGAIGLKTGYTRKAGHTLVAAAKRDGRTMIAVVLDADDPYGTASKLLDQGFATPADAPGTGEMLPAVKIIPARGPAGGSALAKPTFLPATKKASSGSSRGIFRRHPLLTFFALAVTLFVLRRRQIKRRRARRLSRRRVVVEGPALDLSDLDGFDFDDELARRRRTQDDHDAPRAARAPR